eukprot:2527763-Pyramimonas_sp.AAC.1
MKAPEVLETGHVDPDKLDEFEDFEEDFLGDHLAYVNRLRAHYLDKLGLQRWDIVCLRRVFDWCGHVCRFQKYAPDRLALLAL